MTLALALIAVVVGSAYVLLPQWWHRVFGYRDDRDPRWTRKLAERRRRALDELEPLENGRKPR